MDRQEINSLGDTLQRLREANESYLIVAIGARGPNTDCRNGNAVATVRIGTDEATSEALYLDDAIALARAKVRRAIEQRRKADEAKRLAATKRGEAA